MGRDELIRYFHIDHNAPCLLPKMLHNHCLQFFLGITVVPREIKTDLGGAGGGGVKLGALWSM